MDLAKKQEELEEVISSIKDTYRVRHFSTTTEAISFLRKVMPLFSSIGDDFESLKDQDISKLFDIFPPETIEYIISNFVEVKTEKGYKKINYEEEFKSDFQTLLAVFIMAITELIKEVQTPKGKQIPTSKKQIKTQRRG
ncbi:MAG: hypothetical protein EOM78_09750 [Erysipelotrichia bacterium]|nr:hypothetical protein [Erysipelotrichia bacterium]